MSDEKRNEKEPKSGGLRLTGNAPCLWIMATFSPQWFADASHEAATGSDENSIRREVLFSTCFLESYIFEWVRDIDIEAVDYYFPQEARYPSGERNPRYGRRLMEKWKYVPRVRHLETYLERKRRDGLFQFLFLLSRSCIVSWVRIRLIT